MSVEYESRNSGFDGWRKSYFGKNDTGSYHEEDGPAQISLKFTRTFKDEFGNIAEPSKCIAKLTIALGGAGSPRRVLDSNVETHELSAVRPLIETYNNGEYDDEVREHRRVFRMKQLNRHRTGEEVFW